MHLELDPQEQTLLITFLRDRQRELLREIARADIHKFRRTLQDREVVLESVLRKLQPEVVSSTAA
jgi:bisphosphoglycerate-independent phosphoglycerate mutase (AlkP superfamily)